MVYPVGLMAALLLGMGYVLQQRVASTEPLSDLLKFRLLWGLMHRRLWWVGIGCMVLGQLLSGLALQLATVAVVEPLYSTSLLFALAIAALLARVRPTVRELGGAALVSAALGVFLAVGNPQSGHAQSDTGSIAAAVVAIGTAVLLCLTIGKRQGLVGESIWLASGAGLLFGLQDVATRATLVELDHGGAVSVFLHIWVYVLFGCAVLGILLAQSAFKAARLDCSLPPITALEPLAGIALGILLLGDTVSARTGALAAEASCVLAMILGVALIVRSPALSRGGEPPVSPAALAEPGPGPGG
jgi:drug/metabolite transporter (DMT)-like permease